MHKICHKYNYLFHFVFLTTAFSMVGCIGIGMNPSRDSREYAQALETGHEMFYHGDYSDAQQMFQKTFQKCQEPDIRRLALYSLACTHMVMSKDLDEFNEAIDLWKQWHEIVMEDRGGEDPGMFGPLLDKIVMERGLFCLPDDTVQFGTTGQIPSSDQPLPLSDSSAIVQQPLQHESMAADKQKPVLSKEEGEIVLIRKDLEIRRLKEKVNKQQIQIKTLKSQLKSVEEIHQEIMKKKEAVPE
jgi:hypothetical protein